MAKTKRKIQAENTRALLLETGKKQLQQLGADKMTIQSITEACGLSKGLFYHYFKSKDELMLQLERENYIHLSQDIHQLDAPFFDKLRHYIYHRLELMGANDPNFSRQWMNYAMSDAYHEKQGDDTKVTFDFNEIHSILQNGVEEGYLKPDTPIYFLAKLINFTMYGTTLCYRINRGGIDLDVWKKSYSDYLIETCILHQYGTEKMHESF